MIKITVKDSMFNEVVNFVELPSDFYAIIDNYMELDGNVLKITFVGTLEDKVTEDEITEYVELPEEFFEGSNCIDDVIIEFVDEEEMNNYYAQCEAANSEYFEGCSNERELKKMHRQWSMKLHPDRGGNAAEFRAMQEEYEQLKSIFKQPVYAF